MKKLKNKLKQIEREYNVEVLYCTVSGSKLYGTDNPNSDLDVKFVFKPKQEDVLLKQDVEHIKIGANTNVKNTKDDVDFDGYSIYKFMNLLQKSETGAIDIMFSMYRQDTIVFEDLGFTSDIRKNVPKFLNKNMKSFIGYALGQSKKFGIKGARYDELDKFVKCLDGLNTGKSVLLKDVFAGLTFFINQEQFKYIKFVTAPGPRGTGDYKDIEYISVLGKLFEGRVTFEYFYDRVNNLYDQFGNRTKTVAQTQSKTDFKALSHAYRIAAEVEELIDTKHIQFPLSKSTLIKEIKAGKHDVEFCINLIEETLGRVDAKLESTDLPEESDVEFMNEIILNLIKT